MKSSIKTKLATLGFALGLGLTGVSSSVLAACSVDCSTHSWQMQASYCASQRGGSACASSEPLNEHFFRVCRTKYC